MSKILLIDDDRTHLSIRESVLRDAGYEVVTATTAGEALAALSNPPASAPVGLVITDHVMPETVGSSLVRSLRKIDPLIPVLVVTGLVEAEPEYSGLDVQVLPKPCPPADLIKRVEAIIGKPGAPSSRTMA